MLYLIFGVITTILFICSCLFITPLREKIQESMNDRWSIMGELPVAGLITLCMIILCFFGWPLVLAIGGMSLLMYKFKNFKVNN